MDFQFLIFYSCKPTRNSYHGLQDDMIRDEYKTYKWLCIYIDLMTIPSVDQFQ